MKSHDLGHHWSKENQTSPLRCGKQPEAEHTFQALLRKQETATQGLNLPQQHSKTDGQLCELFHIAK